MLAAAGLLMLGANARADGHREGTVITSTENLVSVHDVGPGLIGRGPLYYRMEQSDVLTPTLTNTHGRSLIVQPLIRASFSGGTRIAQNIPNNPPAAPKENPPGLVVPVGPDPKEQPKGPNAPEAAPAAPAPAAPAAAAPAVPDATAPPATTPAVILPPIAGAPVEGTPGTPAVSPDLEGRQIAEVHVVGNRVIPESSILLQATTQRGAALSARQLDIDKAKIDALGFFASVNYQVTQNIADPAKVDVTFIVIENRVVSNYKFEGVSQIKPEDVIKILKTEKGAVLNRNNVATDVESIQRLYREKGFAAVVTESRQLEDGTLVFVVQEGKISSIELSGLKKTKPALVRRQIHTKAGDSFDQKKIREDLNRIYDMGFFDDVSYKVSDDAEKPGFIVVTIVIKEKRTGQLSLGVGFDNRSKISVFASVGESNFRGTGKSLTAGVELGSRRTFELGFGNPFIGKRNASLDVSLFSRVIFREPQSVAAITGLSETFQYEEHRTGGRINYTLPLDDNRRSSMLFGFRDERAKLFQTDSTTGTPIPLNLPINTSGGVFGLSLGFLHDHRDLRLDPSSGGREQLIVERGLKLLGGDTSFTKVDLDLRHYIPLIGSQKVDELPKLVLAARLVVGHSFGQLPAFEQYFIGGPDTVRGYDVDTQFGDNQLFSNIELRYRLQKKFQLVAFTDAGQAKGGSFTSSDSSFLYSIGAGVRVTTPIGPIRLDIGFGKDGARTHFAIGPTF